MRSNVEDVPSRAISVPSQFFSPESEVGARRRREVQDDERLESTDDVGDRVLVGKWTAIFHPLPAPARSDNMSLVCR